MSNIKKNGIDQERQFGGVPYGNLSSFKNRLTLNASGVIADSDDATVLAIGDVVKIGLLPAGMKLEDWHLPGGTARHGAGLSFRIKWSKHK